MTSREQEERINEEIKLLVPLFLKTNASDIELSNRTGISSSTVGRRLTDKRIMELFSAATFAEILIRRQKNLQEGKIRGGKIAMENSNYLKDENGKFFGSEKKEERPRRKPRLNLFYKEEDKQMQILAQLALTFRTKLPVLAEFFDIPIEELETKISKMYSRNKSIQYLFYKEHCVDQEKARQDLEDFYYNFYYAARRGDKETSKKLINELVDEEINQKLKKHVPGEEYNAEETEALLKFQLKYALSQEELASKFNISRRAYAKRVLRFIEDKPEYRVRYEALADYNMSRDYSHGNSR